MESAREACRKAGLSESEIEAWEDHLRGQSAKADAGKPRLTVYDYRDRGRDYCRTEGSEHYQGGIEPMDFLISQDWAEYYCKGNIIKYLARHDRTGNIEDLQKAADYLHILTGLCLDDIPADNEDEGEEEGE